MNNGNDVLALCRQFGLSRSGLARELQVCRATVRRLERATVLPRRDQLMLQGLKMELLNRRIQELSK